MTEKQLADAIAQGESDTLEFKKSTAEREAAMKALCGMLNGAGGRVLIGVTEQGKIRGQTISDATLKDLAQAYAQFEPPAAIRQMRVALANGQEVFIIEVDSSPSAPHTFHGRAYRRLNSTTSIMPQPEYQRRLLERDHSTLRWENRTAPVSPPLDMTEVGLMLRDAVAANRLDSPITDPVQALERLKLAGPAGTTQAAVVAFAVDPFPDYPQCGLRMARFKGITKAEFVDQQQLTGHAFKLLREADIFLRRHLPVAGRFESGVMERIDEPLFPPLALREALVNALIHRDYSIVGGAVSVAVYAERFVTILSCCRSGV
ncbi:MAG TPA: RNA-binding domain-containing protein [Pirellulales bacterium]